MSLRILCTYIPALVVLCSAVPVKEDIITYYSTRSERSVMIHQTRMINNRPENRGYESTFTSRLLKILESKNMATLLESGISEIATQLITSLNQELAETIAELNKLQQSIVDQIAAFHGRPSNEEHSNHVFENMSRSCGGTLIGESGVISYKENEMYGNRENCTWIIEAVGATTIVLNLEKSGWGTCDHVNVASIDSAGVVQHSPLKLRLARSVFVEGPKAMVTFSSNEYPKGKGFRLKYNTIMESSNDSEETNYENECGGVIIGKRGQLSYKPDEQYLNNERCIWLLHSPNSTSISFQLLKSGLEKCCDYITLTTIDPETATIRDNNIPNLKYEVTPIVEPHDYATVKDSMVIIMFSSDSSANGTGFILKFSANGVNANPNYIYKLRHLAEVNGTVAYPTPLTSQSQLNRADDSDDDGTTEQQAIHVIASSNTATATKTGEEFITIGFWNGGVFMRGREGNDSSCGDYDSYASYEPVVIDKGDQLGIWQVLAELPDDNDKLLCPLGMTVAEKRNAIQLETNSFLSIYKQVSVKMNEADEGFGFSFDYYLKSYTCGGTLPPLEDKFGIISYRENVNYTNEQNCRWVIEVPDARGIEFTLEHSGFENWYDFVTVSTLDMADQIQGPEFKLRSGSKIASVKGSRAVVSFKSDETNVGTGFRLRYEKNGPVAHE